jgi:hypothetical protein
MGKKPKTKFTQPRWFIFLVTYFVTAIVIGLIALDLGDSTVDLIDDAFLIGGGVIAILGILFMDRGRTRSSFDASRSYVQTNEQFKRLRPNKNRLNRC